MDREEALLTNVAPLPVLSEGLRTRVLAAAGAARARRMRARRALGGAAVLFGALALFSWSDSLPLVARTPAVCLPGGGDGSSGLISKVGQAPAATAAYCRRDMLISATGDDWQMVEAEFKSREEFTRRARM